MQTGLIVACYHGYVDVVMALSQCPYLDVNWQDNEGNTALITAAQAGGHTPYTIAMAMDHFTPGVPPLGATITVFLCAAHR